MVGDTGVQHDPVCATVPGPGLQPLDEGTPDTSALLLLGYRNQPDVDLTLPGPVDCT